MFLGFQWHIPNQKFIKNLPQGELISTGVDRAVIKRQGLQFPLATKNMAPSYFHRKIEGK